MQDGIDAGAFSVSSPKFAVFAILEMGNNAKAWFDQRGHYTAQDVAALYGSFALRIVGHRDTTSCCCADRLPAERAHGPCPEVPAREREPGVGEVRQGRLGQRPRGTDTCRLEFRKGLLIR